MMPPLALLFVTKVSFSGRPAAVTYRSEDTFTITSSCIAYVFGLFESSGFETSSTILV